jgi:trehalose utilization protein
MTRYQFPEGFFWGRHLDRKPKDQQVRHTVPSGTAGLLNSRSGFISKLVRKAFETYSKFKDDVADEANRVQLVSYLHSVVAVD